MSVADARVHELVAELRTTLGPQWQFTASSGLAIRHRDAGTPYHPPRRVPDWADLLYRLKTAFADHGVPQAPVLPLRWCRDTDLTISAVQALDPYLKHRQPFTYRQGYLPQPVVRFTGERDEHGRLRDGFLTSFVNISCVEPIASVHNHAVVLDRWIGILSRLGLHARHLEFDSNLRVWRRPPVEGITVHVRHAGLQLGDLVLIWNIDDPTHMVTDLGSGLERLRWTISRLRWSDLVFGSGTSHSTVCCLDGIRTATLLVGSGIPSAARGPGNAVRRVLHDVPATLGITGIGAVVRWAYRYWSLSITLTPPWTEVADILERELRNRGRARRSTSH